MSTMTTKKKLFLSLQRPLKGLIVLGLVALLLLSCCACKQKIRYFDYVSELRNNIFLAEEGDLSLRVYAVKKESPYVPDGIPKEIYSRTEIYLSAPSGDKRITCSFSCGETAVREEMSYDNLKGEYYLYSPVDLSALSVLEITLEYEKESIRMQALSILEKDTLSAEHILSRLVDSEKDLFASMTDKYGFTGEIYLRLIFEDAPYYYVGIIEREGAIHAFLIHAKTGKILAKRQS